MFIQTEATPNPEVLKFLPGREVMGEGARDFRDVNDAAASPLAAEIRTKGYAMTRSERVSEMTSVALPVFDSESGFLGAVVVIGLASRFGDAQQLHAVDVVRRELALQGFSAQPALAR